MQNNLDTLLKKVISLLKKEKLEYFLIGGLAVGLLGEPRMTQDIDLILFIEKSGLPNFLRSAKAFGFKCNQKTAIYDALRKGAFKISFGELWVDIIIASTQFEQSALKRKIKTKLAGVEIFLPSSEDFIILKAIPGREKDILDIKTVIERHKGRLNKKYIENWAQILSDEAENLRIWNTISKLLKNT